MSHTIAVRDDTFVALSESAILAHIEEVFGENGFLVRDGGHFNPSQLQYANTVARTLLSSRSDGAPPLGVIEAATGTGKTLGYLVPALLCAQRGNARVIVSTYTKQLQSQLYQDDSRKAARYIQELTGRIIRIGKRLGKRNYLSLEACSAYLNEIDSDNNAINIKNFIAQLIAWAKSKSSPLIPLSDFLDDHNLSSDDIPAGLDYSMLAIGAFSSPEEIETYQAMIKLTNSADLLIVNHAISIINSRNWMSVLEGEGRRSINVFDEADKLDEAAHSVSSQNISIRQTLKSITDGVSRLNKRAEAETQKNAELVESSISIALKYSGEISPDVVQNMKGLLASANTAVLLAAKTIITDKQEFHNRLKNAEFIDFFNDLAQAISLIDRGAAGHLNASAVKGYPRLSVGQSRPARVLMRLWNLQENDSEEIKPVSSSTGVIFTSATLASRTGSFSSFADSVGINTSINKATGLMYCNAQTDLWVSLENTDFGSMDFVLPDQSIPCPTLESSARTDDDEKIYNLSKGWVSYTVSMLKAAQGIGGRVLVLTNSFKASRALAQEAEEQGIGVIEHIKGESLGQYLPGFIADPSSIFISHAAWEGLNLPNTIKHIVISRIPFAPPNTHKIKLRGAGLQNKGLAESTSQGIALSESTDEVVRKLKQGVGRGIRSKTDAVTIWLADPRFPMPDAYTESFDPVMMSLKKRQRKDLRGFIPKRFIPNYNKAPLFINGDLYKVEL